MKCKLEILKITAVTIPQPFRSPEVKNVEKFSQLQELPSKFKVGCTGLPEARDSLHPHGGTLQPTGM